MNIAFFCSNHGYGHILREVSVIEDLADRGNRVIVICGKNQCEQVQPHNNIDTISYNTDVGIIVRPGTLQLDKDKTQIALKQYMQEYNDRISFAKKILSDYGIERVVVDIVPWALDAAK